MSNFSRVNRSLKPAVENLDARIVPSRLGVSPSPPSGADLASLPHEPHDFGGVGGGAMGTVVSSVSTNGARRQEGASAPAHVHNGIEAATAGASTSNATYITVSEGSSASYQGSLGNGSSGKMSLGAIGSNQPSTLSITASSSGYYGGGMAATVAAQAGGHSAGFLVAGQTAGSPVPVGQFTGLTPAVPVGAPGGVVTVDPAQSLIMGPPPAVATAGQPQSLPPLGRVHGVQSPMVSPAQQPGGTQEQQDVANYNAYARTVHQDIQNYNILHASFLTMYNNYRSSVNAFNATYRTNLKSDWVTEWDPVTQKWNWKLSFSLPLGGGRGGAAYKQALDDLENQWSNVFATFRKDTEDLHKVQGELSSCNAWKLQLMQLYPHLKPVPL